MEKLITFLKNNIQYKNIICGLIVGLIAWNAWTAIYSVVVMATALEVKDKINNNSWNWNDWIMTVIGGVAASLLLLL